MEVDIPSLSNNLVSMDTHGESGILCRIHAYINLAYIKTVQ